MSRPSPGSRGTGDRGTGEPPPTLLENVKQQAVLGVLLGLRKSAATLNFMNPLGAQAVIADEAEVWRRHIQGDYEGAFEVATGFKDYFDIRREGRERNAPTDEQLAVMLGHATGFNQAVETFKAEDRSSKELRGLDRALRGVDAGTRLAGTVATVAGGTSAAVGQVRLGLPFSAERAMNKAVGQSALELNQALQSVPAASKAVKEARATANQLAGPSMQGPPPLVNVAKKKPATPPRAPKEKAGDLFKLTLDERIAEAQSSALPAARAKTAAYYKEREAAGRSRKGGPVKGIHNTKEGLWIMNRQRAYPNRQLLDRAEVTGVRGPDGKLKKAGSIAPKGRDPDFVEIDGTKAKLGELKSEWELQASLKGAPGSTTVDPKAKLGGQWAVEDELLEHARKVKGKVVVSGYDVRTGARVEIELDPDQVGRSLFSVTDGWGIGSVFTQ